MFINPFKQKSDKHSSEILSGASISLVMKAAGLLTAYLFAFVVARFFGAGVWGEFSLALSMITFGAVLGTAGLDVGFLKIAAGLDDNKEIRFAYSPALLIVTVFSISISVLLFLGSGWLAETLFRNPGLDFSFKLAAFAVFPLSIINLNGGTLQGLSKINKYVFIRFVSRHISALIILFIFLLFWPQSQIVLISYIAGIYLVAGLSFFWLMKEGIRPVGIKNLLVDKFTSYSRLLKVSMPLLFAGSLMFLNSWIDTIMVGIFMTEHDVGVYNIALKTSGLLLLILTSVNIAVAPKFSELYSKNNTEELKEIVRYSVTIIFYATLPLFIILLLLPEQVLSVFGEEFRSGKYALMILCIGSMFSAFAGSVGNLMQMTDSQVAFQNITLISSLLGFVLNLILIPAYGIEGAAMATSMSMIFWNTVGILLIRYKYNILTFYRPFLKWRKS